MAQSMIITFGGWYQRTTLHLSEVFDLMKYGTSNLPLDKDTLKKHQNGMRLVSVDRVAGLFDHILAHTSDGIEIRYYEDGLYVLEKAVNDADLKTVDKTAHEVKTYFEQSFSPGIAYIFSLGAPTPKVVANITTVHPTVLTVLGGKFPADFFAAGSPFGDVYQKIASSYINVYKTKTHIMVEGNADARPPFVRDLIENQIFFREFKDQLAKYLNVHRTLWEEIAAIKEKPYLRSDEIQKTRTQLESYQLTINLITNRINQMGTYIALRGEIAGKSGLEDLLRDLFEFRFDVLKNTLEYVKEIWKMTSDQLDSAVELIIELQGRTTQASINSLRAVTTFGVLSSLITFTALFRPANVAPIGVASLVVLLSVAWLIDRAIQQAVRHKKFKMNATERAKQI